ncbi:hypothetical protein D3C77_436390 [compost metagenome]
MSSVPGPSVTVTVVSPDASSFSKLPPVTDSMLLVRLTLVSWTLFGAVSCTVPVVSPTAMVICWPLARLITSGFSVTAELTVAV